MKIVGAAFTELIYDTSVLKKSGFTDTEIKEVNSVMPDNKYVILSFEMNDTNVSYANGIRRTVIEELEVKALTCPIIDISTTETLIVKEELKSKLEYLILYQDIDPNVTFRLNVKNTGNDVKYVYAFDLIPSKGKISDHICSLQSRLCFLTPGKEVKVSNITIESGLGCEHSKFSLTSEFTYESLDDLKVKILDGRTFRDCLILKSEVKIVGDKPVLIIRNKDYEKLLSEEDRLKLPNFQKIYDPKSEVKIYNTTQLQSKNFKLGFKFYGNFDHKKIFSMVYDNLSSRFIRIKKIFQSIEKKEYKNDDIVYLQGENETRVIIKNESYTVGEILRYNIITLVESIPLVKTEPTHVDIRSVTLILKHTEPLKLILNAIDLALKNLEHIANIK